MCSFIGGHACAGVQCYHEKGVGDTTQIPFSPKWPPLRIYRALLTAKPWSPFEHTVLCVLLAAGTDTSQEMAPFFLRLHSQNALYLPSALTDVEKAVCAVTCMHGMPW